MVGRRNTQVGLRDTARSERPSRDASLDLDERLQRLVPGGAHTYAKGIDQFPEGCAPVLERGSGCHVWDVDGNEYIELGMGLRAVTLGHGYPAVVDAIAAQLPRGTNFVRPSRLELDAAETFVGLVTRADMVKFTKDGSTANTAAVKLARTFTGRDLVALCVDHPFFSYDDWAMVATPVRSGIPASVEDLTLTFRYDDLASVEELLSRHPGEIACFVLEPERASPPSEGYLQRLHELVAADGALLVLDENVSGFRWHTGGAQEVHDVTPDLSTWGKGIANGFALSALAGRREIMELGGLEHDRERVFLLSTTHGAEHVGLAAGIATMATYRDEPVIETLHARGDQLRDGVQAAARARGIQDRFTVAGRGSCLFFGTADAEGVPSQAFRTLFLQETITRGLLAPSFVVSYSHSEADIAAAVEIVDEALDVYAAALEGGVERFLRGRPVQPVYRRFN